MTDFPDGFPDYFVARCCVITKKGTRCKGRWKSASGITLAWDPVAGKGTSAPGIVLCHRHQHLGFRDRHGDPSKRTKIDHDAWLGWLAPHYYYLRPFAAPTGNAVAQWWLDRAQPSGAGQSTRKDVA